jgi:hypothetical protein
MLLIEFLHRFRESGLGCFAPFDQVIAALPQGVKR